MTITELSTAINAVVLTIANAVFMRATDNEANTDIDNVDLSGKTIVLFNNLPDIGHTISRSGYTTQQFPVEIKVLQLANIDDREHQSDTIRDACLAVAYQVFDKLSAQQNIPDTFDYNVSLLNETKIYDKTMTGCTLKFTFNANRGSYGC